MDRSHYPTRKLKLAEEGSEDLSRLTAAQLVEMVRTLTAQAWTFMQGSFDEPRLRRDVVRTVRGRR